MGQWFGKNPLIKINNYVLEVIHECTCLESILSDSLSLNTEVTRRNGRAAINLARLISTELENWMITTNDKIAVYRSCVVSVMHYGSKIGDFTQHKSDDIDLFIFAEMHLFICWFERGTNDLVLIPACYPTFMFSSNSTGSACLGMDTVYRMCAFRMPFCQENSPPARGNEDDLVFALKTSPKGTWIRWTWLSRGVSRSPTTTHAGNAIYTRGCSEETRNVGLALAVTVLDGEKHHDNMHSMHSRLSLPCETVKS